MWMTNNAVITIFQRLSLWSKNPVLYNFLAFKHIHWYEGGFKKNNNKKLFTRKEIKAFNICHPDYFPFFPCYYICHLLSSILLQCLGNQMDSEWLELTDKC